MTSVSGVSDRTVPPPDVLLSARASPRSLREVNE